MLLDARNIDYIDPDMLDLIDEYRRETAPAHGIKLNLVGFKNRYPIGDHVEYISFTIRDIQCALTPDTVLDVLRKGNEQSVSGHRISRDFSRQVSVTAAAQFPMAVVLSCIDSRSLMELIFDLGLGNAFVIRIAGNVAKKKVPASIEFGYAVAEAKLILVLGHTSCGAIKAAVELFESGKDAAEPPAASASILLLLRSKKLSSSAPNPLATGSHRRLSLRLWTMWHAEMCSAHSTTSASSERLSTVLRACICLMERMMASSKEMSSI